MFKLFGKNQRLENKYHSRMAKLMMLRNEKRIDVREFVMLEGMALAESKIVTFKKYLYAILHSGKGKK